MVQPAPFSNVMTPDEIAQKRRMAQLLMQQGTDASPVGHWTQGLARVVQGGVGGYQMGQANQGQKDRNSAVLNALRGDPNFGKLSPGLQGVVSQDPSLTNSVVGSMVGHQLDPNAGLNRRLLEARVKTAENPTTEDIREYEYAAAKGYKGGFDQWMALKKAPAGGNYGQNGQIFKGPDGNFYSVQFGRDGSLKTQPITASGGGLTPSKGVERVGSELVDKSTGRPVRNVSPQIEGGKVAEEVGTARGKAQVNLGSNVNSGMEAFHVVSKALRHPGAWKNFGAVGAFPNYPGGDAANAKAFLDQISGINFLEAYKGLRGGGTITEIEGQKAEAAKARLSRAQNWEQAKAALVELQGSIIRNIQGAYSDAGQKPPSSQEVLRMLHGFNPTAGLGGKGSPAIDEARAAIAKGAPRDKVIERLRQNGIDPAGL